MVANRTYIETSSLHHLKNLCTVPCKPSKLLPLHGVGLMHEVARTSYRNEKLINSNLVLIL